MFDREKDKKWIIRLGSLVNLRVFFIVVNSYNVISLLLTIAQADYVRGWNMTAFGF